jgi:hypothetical protein
MVRGSRRSMVRVAGVCVALALLAAACSSSDDPAQDASTDSTAPAGALDEKVAVDAPGVTDAEIRYSVLATESNNPFGTCILECYAAGIEAYFDYVNTELGGIYGRKLVVTDKVDDEFLKNQEKALEILTADDTFATFSSTAVATGWPDFAADGVPLYVWASIPSALEGQQSTFGEVTVRCQDPSCPDRVVPYLMKVSDKHKLASIGYAVAKGSCDFITEGVAAYSEQIGAGAEVAYNNQDLQFGLPNGVAPEVTAMKNSGADILSGCTEVQGMKTFMDEAIRQNLDIVPLVPQDLNEEQLAQLGAAFEGGYLRSNIRSFQGELNEAQEKYREYMAKTGGKEDIVSIYGWINAALAYEGLEQAGPDFSREKVIDATNQLTAFTAGGLTPPQNWTIGHDAPSPETADTTGQAYECYSITQIVDGELTLVGEPDKPFTCWPGTTWDWDEGWPQAMSFD